MPSLGELTAILLDSAAQPGDLHSAAVAMHDLFASIAPVDQAIVETSLPSGKALSPSLAATCVEDSARTAAFLRGIDQAVRTREPREVLYAGTGPFAPLLLPLMPRYPDLNVTFLDIHQHSIDSVRKLAEHFGVRGHFVVGDATEYRHPRAIDLLVVETMQAALSKEPQVAIMRHLATQLANRGTMIPQNVVVEVMLVDGGAETARAMGKPLPPDARIRLGNVVDLRSGTFELSVRVPEIPAVERYTVAYFTRIEVFGDHKLDEYESGLTHPKMVWELKPIAGETLTFRYRLGPDPGVVWERS